MDREELSKMNTLQRLFEADTSSMYDARDDNSGYALHDTRKPKLTLKILNRLRKYREFKDAEMEERYAVIAVVYAQPENGGDAGGL